MRGRQRPRAPIAVRRIEHQHLLGALLETLPQLNEMKSVLDPIAGPHRNLRAAPEAREGVTDQLPFRILEHGDAARLELERRVAPHRAVPKIRRRPVDQERAHVGRVHGFDREPAHVAGHQVERDVVLLGA